MRTFATACLLLVLAAFPARAQTVTDISLKEALAPNPDSLAKAQALGNAITTAQAERLLRPQYAGQTIRFTAVVLSDPLNSGLATAGANPPGRVHFWVRDTTAAGDAAGMAGYTSQVVDGSYQANGLLSLAPGYVVRLTALLNVRFGTVQLEPSVPYEIIADDFTALGLPETLDDPITVTLDELMAEGAPDPASDVPNQSFLNLANYLRLQQEFVRLEGLRVARAEFGGNSRPDFIFTNAGNTRWLRLGDTSLRYRNDKVNDPGYAAAGFNVRTAPYVAPAVGATVNVQGYLVYGTFETEGAAGRFNPNVKFDINPMADADLVVTQTPPQVFDLAGVTTLVDGQSDLPLTATARADAARTLASATLRYTIGEGTEQSVAATLGTPGTTGTPLSASIPAAALTDGAFVQYRFVATDSEGAQGSSETKLTRVYSGIINRIALVQETFTGGPADSPLTGVTLDAAKLDLTVVIASQPDTSGVVIVQDDEALGAWSGIQVQVPSAARDTLLRGDRMHITGAKVEESFGLTRLNNVTWTRTARGQFYGYKVVPPSILLDAATAEAHESMMLRFENVFVVSTNADGPNSNFGEMTVNETQTAAVGIRVDDASPAVPDRYNDSLAVGDKFDFVQGYFTFSFSNFKLEPEVPSDLMKAEGTAAEGVVLPGGFALGGVAPSPVRTTAQLAFQLDAPGHVTLAVYDVTGRRVALLVDGVLPQGPHQATFDASGLASGVYVYRLAQSGQARTGTLVVAR